MNRIVPEFVPVARASDIPEGTGKVVRLQEVEIALFRVNGRFYALSNMCPHRGGPLGEGEVDGMLVACPWHCWDFDVTTGRSPSHPAARVATYDVRIIGEDICVGLGI